MVGVRSVRDHTDFPVFLLPDGYEKLSCFWPEESFVYDADLVRKLCVDVLNEADPDKVEELIAILRAVIRDDQEDARARMTFLAKKYGHFLADAKAAD